MKIELDVSAERIADMMVSFVESGDPVTSAARGGWCVSVANKSRKKINGAYWYADKKYFDGPFLFEVVELDDENSGHKTKHQVRPENVKKGLTIMATKFPHRFKEILADNTDAPCADIFMQCVLFGDEKYA